MNYTLAVIRFIYIIHMFWYQRVRYKKSTKENDDNTHDICVILFRIWYFISTVTFYSIGSSRVSILLEIWPEPENGAMFSIDVWGGWSRNIKRKIRLSWDDLSFILDKKGISNEDIIKSLNDYLTVLRPACAMAFSGWPMRTSLRFLCLPFSVPVICSEIAWSWATAPPWPWLTRLGRLPAAEKRNPAQ